MGAIFAETMEALAKNFSLERPVVEALLKTKIENLEEFRFLFGDKSKIDVFLDKLTLEENRVNQGAQLRRCWTAVSLHFKTAEQDCSKVSTTDLDSMLANTELRNVKKVLAQVQDALPHRNPSFTLYCLLSKP